MKKPQHILITGASSGLGAALALEYASPALRLSLHGRNTERLEQIAAQARKQGAEVFTYIGDIVEAGTLSAWIKSCDKETAIDLVIANAGISAGTAKGAESAEQVKAIFDTNVTGTFNTLHPIISIMSKRKHGQIAIVSSLAGFRGLPGAPAYCASKAAVRVYGEGLRSELARYNVQVNVICPGFIKTPMTDANPFSMPFLMSAERAAKIIRKGLSNNQARIAFPWIMYAGVNFLMMMPQILIDLIATRTPRK